MGVRQVSPWDVWPSGDSRPIAVLPFDLPELSSRYGLRWHAAIDDLGPYQMAAIALGDGEQAWLVRYADDPNPGTLVYIDAAFDVRDSLSRLLQELDIRFERLIWTAPAQRNEPIARFG